MHREKQTGLGAIDINRKFGISEDWNDGMTNPSALMPKKTSYVELSERKPVPRLFLPVDLKNTSSVHCLSQAKDADLLDVSLKHEVDPHKSDIHKEYCKLVKAQLFGKKPDESELARHASVPIFKRTEGIFLHQIDKVGMFQKRHLVNYLRDGHQFIQKVDRELEHSIEPENRCKRHDRHLL